MERFQDKKTASLEQAAQRECIRLVVGRSLVLEKMPATPASNRNYEWITEQRRVLLLVIWEDLNEKLDEENFL